MKLPFSVLDTKNKSVLESSSIKMENQHIDDNGKLVFTITGHDDRPVELSVGDGEAVCMLIAKVVDNEVLEIEAIYNETVSATPKMCCQCGRVRVCGNWCRCAQL